MPIPLVALASDALKPFAKVTHLDLLIGRVGAPSAPIHTAADLEAALLRVKEFLDANAHGAVGIIADRYQDRTLQVYTVVKALAGMRVCIQAVEQPDMLILDTKPLIDSQPHLLYTWSGIQGFARTWFDTLQK